MRVYQRIQSCSCFAALASTRLNPVRPTGYCHLIPPVRPTSERSVPAVKRLLIAASLVAFIAAPAAFADNWPQWRGPKNDGHSAEKGLPTEWGPEKNVVWKLVARQRGVHPVRLGRQDFPHDHGWRRRRSCFASAPTGKEKWRQTMSSTGQAIANGPERGDRRVRVLQHRRQARLGVRRRQASRPSACHDLDGKLVWETNLRTTASSTSSSATTGPRCSTRTGSTSR